MPATARVSGFGLYGVLYDYVPGFNGVRVPGALRDDRRIVPRGPRGLRRRELLASSLASCLSVVVTALLGF